MTVVDASVQARLDEVERSRWTDIAACLAEARDLERLTAPAGGTLFMRARLVVADMVQRGGDLAGGLRLASEVLQWAQAHDERQVLARAHLVLSRIVDYLGDFAASMTHALNALQALGDDGTPTERATYLLRLADCLSNIASADAARLRYLEAEAISARSGDRELHFMVLNNLCTMETDVGNAAGAALVADRLEQAHGDWLDPLTNACAADTVAQARLLAGDLAAAESSVLEAEAWLQRDSDDPSWGPASLALTHARIRLAAGDVAAATERLEECLNLCAEHGLQGLRVKALKVRAAAFAAAGDFEAAYRSHCTFHDEFEQLRFQQAEAAANARHDALETEQARHQARQFWEQARRDPLTGLFNRRYVDEHLPGLLERHGPDHGCLVTAMVDVDHFKQVNDRFSHDVGDEVLRRLAALLQGCLAAREGDGSSADDFAARLGGEEFLVVLHRRSSDDALADLEAIRACVEAYGWDDVHDGLQVTVSVGAAVASDGDLAAAPESQRSLLTRADHHLYAAKHGGRNRVISDVPAEVRQGHVRQLGCR